MPITTIFLDRLDDLAEGVRASSRVMPDKPLCWISANRDFGEDERYREKDDVDTSLTTSAVISEERAAIEAVFESDGSLKAQVRGYEALLHRQLVELHSALVDATGHIADEQVDVWLDLAKLADVDNAHAMYLSSGNWDFSVFNNTVAALEKWSGDDHESMSAILTGGMADVRTEIYGVFGTTYEGLDRDRFVAAVRANDDWTRPGGYVTIMCFGAATGERGRPRRLSTGAELAERFEAAVESVAMQNPDAPVADTARLFRRLYDLRRRYDIYEYFGAYAYYRNLAIRDLGASFGGARAELVKNLRYLATTYQFAPVVRTLRSLTK